MDSHSLQVLEFNLVVDEVASYCLTEEGRALLREQPIITDSEEHKRRLQMAVDVRRLLESGEKEPVLNFPPVAGILAIVQKEGSVLEPAELLSLALFCNSAIAFGTYIRKWVEANKESPLSIFFPFPHINEVIREIYFYFEKGGRIREKNIPELKKISRSIAALKSEIHELVEKYLKNIHYRDYWQSDLPAQRSKRTVLPLKANFKNRIKGIVHEVSATGATLFIEPYEVVEKNNLLAEKENQYKSEVHRILRMISDHIRNHLDDIRLTVEKTAELDTCFGRARYSLKHKCVPAENIQRGLRLRKARHPLLGKECIPIDLDMGEEMGLLVISGPNTGGKTVTLKTAGLLSTMNQFGMEIPAGEGTALALFSDILVDIGDEQSIKESLSTFSAHLVRQSSYLKCVKESSLLLLDELGAGTDAEEGSALAMAMLDAFMEKECTVLITTHQNLLKNYASATPRAENASMDFDTATFTPTYRLHIGFPGESHAIEIAVRSGLPENIVRKAKSYLKTGKTDVSRLIKDLNEKNRELAERENELVHKEKEFLQEIESYKEDRKRLAEREIELKREGIRDLRKLLSESRKTLENLVRRVKETRGSPETSKEVKVFLKGLDEKTETLMDNIEKEEEQFREIPEKPLSVGAMVKIRSTGKAGTILRRGKKDSWIVETGSVRISMKEGDLIPITAEKKNRPQYDIKGIAPLSKAVFELDLRGFRLEEAIESLKKQIDSCLVSGLYEFSIIHGFGEGVLQNGVHQFLKESRAVVDYHFAHPDDGGFGKTLVSLARKG